jgi:putative cardiolipin synthase
MFGGDGRAGLCAMTQSEPLRSFCRRAAAYHAPRRSAEASSIIRVKAPKILLVCAVTAMSVLLTCCKALPDLSGRSVSKSLEDTDDTRLGRAIAPLARAHPGKSGVFALADGREAFAARTLLSRAADRSIDVQYYIWRHDMSGTLLFEELHDAADRGVRVRLLLDDNNTIGLDLILSMLDAHPNIEVRLFNPFMHRRVRALGFLTDFARACTTSRLPSTTRARSSAGAMWATNTSTPARTFCSSTST